MVTEISYMVLRKSWKFSIPIAQEINFCRSERRTANNIITLVGPFYKIVVIALPFSKRRRGLLSSPCFRVLLCFASRNRTLTKYGRVIYCQDRRKRLPFWQKVRNFAIQASKCRALLWKLMSDKRVRSSLWNNTIIIQRARVRSFTSRVYFMICWKEICEG